MTRYVCAHPSHARRRDDEPVDVTPQVRLELARTPRPWGYLAISEHVIPEVQQLAVPSWSERRAAIEQIITGEDEPADGPVVLLSERNVNRPPGRYELDDLRPNDPGHGRLPARIGGAPAVEDPPGDIIVVEEPDLPPEPSMVSGLRSISTSTTMTRTRVIPQGVFALHDLSASLAAAGDDEDAIADAIRSTPSMTLDEGSLGPWRVAITCPVPEGNPLALHEIVFTSLGEPLPAVVYGTPIDAWDAMIEESAITHLAPAAETARLEWRLGAVMLAEVAASLAVLLAAWASGALGQAARETPGWLGFAFVLAVAALAVAAIPLFVARDPYANPNDLFVIGRHYAHRIDVLRLGAGISAGVFGLALLFGIAPPLLDSHVPVPAATVSFSSQTTLVRVVSPSTVTTPSTTTSTTQTSPVTPPSTAVPSTSASPSPSSIPPASAVPSVGATGATGGSSTTTTTTTGTTATTPLAATTVSTPVSATMSVSLTELGSDDTVRIVMREYALGDDTGVVIGSVTRHGRPSGRFAVRETFALTPGVAFVSVLVMIDGEQLGPCTTVDANTPGCTVVAVPQTSV